MSDIFSEVDSALAEDRAKALWDRYGKLVISSAFALIAITAFTSFYSHHLLSKAKKDTALLIQALDSEQPLEQLEAIATNQNGVHSMIASMNQAKIYAENGDIEQALNVYKALIANNKSPSIFKNYAVLSFVSLGLSQQEALQDDEYLEQALTMLKELQRQKSSPWQHHARILSATILGDRQQDFQAALDAIEPLTDEKAMIPESLRKRALALQHVYRLSLHQHKSSASSSQSLDDNKRDDKSDG